MVMMSRSQSNSAFNHLQSKFNNMSKVDNIQRVGERNEEKKKMGVPRGARIPTKTNHKTQPCVLLAENTACH